MQSNGQRADWTAREEELLQKMTREQLVLFAQQLEQLARDVRQRALVLAVQTPGSVPERN